MFNITVTRWYYADNQAIHSGHMVKVLTYYGQKFSACDFVSFYNINNMKVYEIFFISNKIKLGLHVWYGQTEWLTECLFLDIYS